MPPIYQPEIPADAVWEAAHSNRRQIYVGGSTVMTIWGNKVAPWLADRYLARTGVSSQLTEQPAAPRDGNLFEPPSSDQGAHGGFDDQAHSRSYQWWLTKHRRSALGSVTAVAGGALAAATVLLRR